MNKILKRLVSLALVAIIFTIFQATQCMEEELQKNPSNKRLYKMAFPNGQIPPEGNQEKKGKWNEITVSSFEECPEEIRLNILKYAASALLDSGTVSKLPVVCKEWQSLIKQHKIDILKFAICQVYPVDLETCERFLNGKLTYKPNEDNDIGKVELRIADLVYPLEGTFDLSKCGDAGQYLSISTGYRKGKKVGNKEKVEIWLTPRFLVEKEINGKAQHLQGIFLNGWPDTAPIGIFWTLSDWDTMNLYEGLTDQGYDELSVGNLYEKYVQSYDDDFQGLRAAGEINSARRDSGYWDKKERDRLFNFFLTA